MSPLSTTLCQASWPARFGGTLAAFSASLAIGSGSALTAEPPPPPKGYPEGVSEIRYLSTADNTQQPALFWAPHTEEPRPLLVALHTWSGNFRQAGGEAKYAEWCQKQNWVFLHPDFRGPNWTPDAMGSELVIADIASAIEWAGTQAKIDPDRIYCVGVSGGGYASMLVAGRLPHLWAGVSAWCGISDLAAWHAETSEAGRNKYAEHIEQAAGGPPGSSPEVDGQLHARSALTWLPQAVGVNLDINHGLDDGRSGSVPFTHSLHAWNAVAAEPDRLSDEAIDLFYRTRKPSAGEKPIIQALYEPTTPIFQRQSGTARVTIFSGGHEINHVAALNWLAAQRRGQAPVWDPPKIGDLDLGQGDRDSGK